MICLKCHCDFYFNCGKRRFGIKFLGSHESRFSSFKCKYNLYSDEPILPRTDRGLGASVATIGAEGLLAVGTTIGAPTYGIYRLVRHIRNKRQAQHFTRPTILTSTNRNESDDYDDIEPKKEMFKQV